MSIKPAHVIPGQLSATDAEGIIALAQQVPAGGIIVEVGSLYGLSSWLWSKNAHPSVRIVCIDPWKHERWVDKVRDKFATVDLSIEAFRANVADCPNIETIQGYSPDCCTDWNTPIDLYFDDADHRNPVLGRNLDFWSRFVKLGGIVSGHDYSTSHPDVVAEAQKTQARVGGKLSVTGTVWSVKKA